MIRRVVGRGSGGGGFGRAHRVLRRGVPLALLLALVSTGCATKRDVADIRGDLDRLEARQDSIYQLLQTQNRQILDSLAVTTEELLNVRGDLANQLAQLRDQLVQIGELTGQVQIRLNQFDQEIAAAIGQMGGAAAAGGGVTGGDPGEGATLPEDAFDEAREIYEAGLEQVDRGNPGTARRAFQTVLQSHPNSPVAPQAQFQIGETHVMERQFDEALRAFDQVVSRYQDSDAAPRALYRAGVISRERGQLERAREYFRRVISGYPESDARRLAEQALEGMGG